MSSGLNFKLSQQEFISSMLPQHLALPYNFMRYIQEKQTSKVYEKLIKTCKYFFYSKGFVVVVDIYDPLYNQIRYFGREIKAQIKLPEKWENQQRKLWISDKIFVCSNISSSTFYPLNSLTEKIYRCENLSLIFRGQSLKYEELKVISEIGTFKNFSISVYQIVDQNETEVLLEDIIALFPNVKEFFISNKKIRCSSESAKALSMFSKLKRLTLYGIPEVFNIEDFIIFVKTHETNRYFIEVNPDAPATYIIAFKNAINSIYTDWDSDFTPPAFNFLRTC